MKESFLAQMIGIFKGAFSLYILSFSVSLCCLWLRKLALENSLKNKAVKGGIKKKKTIAAGISAKNTTTIIMNGNKLESNWHKFSIVTY